MSRCKSISEAAQQLYISQPSLSISIAHLEKELNCEIFKRAKSGIQLTSEGVRVVKIIEDILASMELMQQLAEQDAILKGEISLYMPPSIFNAFAARLLAHFYQHYPAVHLQIYEENHLQVVDRLSKGQASIGVASWMLSDEAETMQLLAQKNLTCRKIGQCPMWAYMCAGHQLETAAILSVHDLAQETLINYKDPSNATFKGLLLPEDMETLTVYNCENVKRLVAAGVGITIFPVFWGEEDMYIKRGLLVGRPVKEWADDGCWGLVTERGNALSGFESAVLEILFELLVSWLEEVNI